LCTTIRILSRNVTVLMVSSFGRDLGNFELIVDNKGAWLRPLTISHTLCI
jgi:hypothetical protein